MRTLASGSIDLKSLKVAGEPNKYVTMIDGSGIRVHEAGAVNTNFAQINSSGLQVYKGGTAPANKVADFGETVRIGKDGKSHIELDYHSLQLKDKEGNSYFYVSDLRDSSGSTELTVKYVGNGTTRSFNFLPPADNTNYTVTVSDDSGGSIESKGDTGIVFSTAPSDDAIITITYTTSHIIAKAYTFGLRKANTQFGALSVSEGYFTEASGPMSHSEGRTTEAKGFQSHAEGYGSIASGSSSHAEGDGTKATKFASHAEGQQSEASGGSSHAEGYSTKATGLQSHAEGYITTASSQGAHSEGMQTTASNEGSHAEGVGSRASGIASHASGASTRANGTAQTAIGKYNVEDAAGASALYALIIGNGTSNNSRKNALTVDWDGNIRLKGDIYTGCNDDSTGGTNISYKQSQTITALGKQWIFRRIGSTVYVDAPGDSNASISAGMNTVGTLNTGLRPTNPVYLKCTNINDDVRLVIDNTTGTVQLYAPYAWSGAHNCAFCGNSYLAS